MDKPQVEQILSEAVEKIRAAADGEALDHLRIAYLGRNGTITRILRSIKELPSEQRVETGRLANEARAQITGLLAEQKEKFGHQRKGSALDRSLPGLRPLRGAAHPLYQTIREIEDIFTSLGFEIVGGREVETEFHNFTALNIPLDHPSRDAFDTFYTEHRHLLRSQTSTVQIRVMEKRKPPLSILAPGRVYRPDTVDASHSFMFHQVEGLLVDGAVRFTDLKGLLNFFLKRFFSHRVRTRLRPHFFPFTEPSVEVDVSCILCDGKGCSTCGRSGWLEVMGAGMVDPEVFKQVGYPAGKYQGLAFGMGVERLTMLRHGIHDIRLFFENDLHFLRQCS